MADSTIHSFVAEQRELLSLELQADDECDEYDAVCNHSIKSSSENAKTVKHQNLNNDNREFVSHRVVLGNLEASDISVGLYGRTVVQLTLFQSESNKQKGLNHHQQQQQKQQDDLLPAHRFTVGDEVEIRSKKHANRPKRDGFLCGVVNAVSDSFISVALFQTPARTSTTNKISNDDNNSKKMKNYGSQVINEENHDDNDENDDNNEDGLGTPPLTLVPRSSVEVHKKLLKGLAQLESNGVNHPIAGPIIQAMFHAESLINTDANMDLRTTAAPSLSPTLPPSSLTSQFFKPFNPRLDESQIEAIKFALDPDCPIALIHGPPGTGKTTTVVELILQAVHVHHMKVLVTAPSNVAVDNILERLVEQQLSKTTSKTTTNSKKKGGRKETSSKHMSPPPLRAVRLGHPARIKSSIISHSLEALVQNSEGTEIVSDVRQELQSFLTVLSNPKSRPNVKRIAYKEIKALRKELRTREEKVVQELIASAQIVLATTVGADNKILDKIINKNHNSLANGGFDLVVIDEAAQALEASCWIPILKGKKVVLAGDHCQLPPTIKSKQSRVQKGLGKTMFERLLELYGDDSPTKEKPRRISRMLNVQYRMHHSIADWASQAMYHGELKTHPSVHGRLLSDLGGISQLEEQQQIDNHQISKTTLLLIDTAGCQMHETINSAGSRYNQGESEIVAHHVQILAEIGIAQEQMCVITPYNGQVEILRNLLLPDYPKLEIRSVDGFQGGERDVVILSLVRSSPSSHQGGGKSVNGIGFLKDDRRQNVAVTRAKRHLAVVCDSETVSQSPLIASLVAWIEKQGEQRSALEYLHEKELLQGPNQPDETVLKKFFGLSNISTTNSKALNNRSKVTMEQQPLQGSDKKVPQKGMNAEERKALLDKIAAFAASGKPGDEMALSTEFSSYDRRLVHEFCEEIGLGHQSEGISGKGRRIILRRMEKVTPNIASIEPIIATEKSNVYDDATSTVAHPSTFAALMLDDDSDNTDLEECSNPSTFDNCTDDLSNGLLGDLARERAQRRIQQQKEHQEDDAATGRAIQMNTSARQQRKKTTSKFTGQKLGGMAPKATNDDDDWSHLDDDMAFLDAQIERSQNAHGRTIYAKGQNYRTIVSGILNARPEPQRVQPQNKKAAASLHSKLKEAQQARKAKSKKKK